MRAGVAFLVLAPLCGCGGKHPDQAPLSAGESMGRIRLSEDFRVELYAAEPEVVDPAEMVFDENGRAFVAEMLDYPDDPPAGRPARSRIRMLEDTDGDGRIDRSTLFADRVLQVSGLMPWRGGLIVGSAPDILYMKDTDGDGDADTREVLYTGFPKVNPEGRITNFRLGVDNWVYAANNGADGRITSPRHPERPPLVVRGADFRFHLIRDIGARSSGPAQFGLTLDDFGNRFITQNTIHLRHAVVPMEYLENAPGLEVPAVSHDLYSADRRPAPMFALTRPQQWRVQRTGARQQRYNETHPGRVEYLAGYITGASGSTLYSGDVFPREYWGNIFTGDVSANLVRRDIITPDGVTFAARPARDGVEFLASSDAWFRPCHFANAPDGNLYLLDMYREFIETPESIPEQIKKGLDFWSGDTMGRVYRIVPNHPLRTRSLKVNLGRAAPAELVGELENTNGWHRQTAQRLLVERQDASVAPLLTKLARSSDSPAARVRALWTLEGIGALKPEHVLAALPDTHPGVREQAVKLAEIFLDGSAPVRNAVLARGADPDIRVEFQTSFTLGRIDDPRALSALARLAAARGEDRWFRTAILSAVADRPARFLAALLTTPSATGGKTGRRWQRPEFLRALGSLIGARRRADEIGPLISAAPLVDHPESVMRGLARGLDLSRARGLAVAGIEPVFLRLSGPASPEAVRIASLEAAKYFRMPEVARRASADALNAALSPALRAAAVSALAGGDFDTASPVLAKVLTSAPAPEAQSAAIDAFASFPNREAAQALLDHFRGYGPAARPKAIAALLERKEWTLLMLDAMERGRLEAGSIDVAARARLFEHPDAAIRERTRILFQADSADRSRAVEQHRDVLRMASDVERGKKVFEEHCARCHMPRRQAGRIGPDLSGVNNKTKEELLASLLNPSAAVEARFVNYIVTTRDGRMLDGVIAVETPGALTLRGGVAEEDVTILRSEIVEIRASAISLMPDGLEESMKRQDLADVIAYLRAGL